MDGAGENRRQIKTWNASMQTPSRESVNVETLKNKEKKRLERASSGNSVKKGRRGKWPNIGMLSPLALVINLCPCCLLGSKEYGNSASVFSFYMHSVF